MKKNFSTIEEFKKEALEDQAFLDELKKDPRKMIEQLTPAANPIEWDKFIYRTVVLILGLVVLFTVIGLFILLGTGQISEDKDIPTVLTAVVSTSVGAIAGLLTPNPSSK